MKIRYKSYVKLMNTTLIQEILILDAALRKANKFHAKKDKIQDTPEVTEVLNTIREKIGSLPSE